MVPGLLGECAYYVGDAGAQGGDIVRVDAGEHCDTELVAPELAVGLEFMRKNDGIK